MQAMPDPVERVIAQTYDSLAQAGESDLCCSPLLLYDSTELASLPAGAVQLSSGCGDPTHFAQIRPGVVVVDIGSGAGLDCLKAAKLTGPGGRVIGVDPSEAMRAAASSHARQLGLDWLVFEDGTADHLPLPDSSADVVISNCVLSLATEPRKVWLEIARVLKPGGRFAVSDIVGGDAREDLRARTRCEVGVSWTEYLTYLEDARFSGIRLIKASPVRFRDGVSAQSVSLSGRYAPSPPMLFIHVLAPSNDLAFVSRTVTSFVSDAPGDLGVDFEVLPIDGPEAQCLLRLASETPGTAQLERDDRVYILANGRVAGSWIAATERADAALEVLQRTADGCRGVHT
jgi:SAM-dependent methyltransferase